ncbi:MAG: hypothetical protein U0703_12665 [Anaerolineae bacterium]
MSIVVFTRSTPDTAAKVEVDGNGNVTWGDAATVVNPWDEYALEEAILQAKAGGGKSVVVAIGAEMHGEALKHSLAMGLDEAIRVWDDLLQDADLAGIRDRRRRRRPENRRRESGDLRQESVDVGTDQHIYQIARKLGWTMLSYVSKISGGRLRRRDDQGGAAAGRRQAGRDEQAARRDQRDEGHQRAALPVVHRHPQGVESGHPGVVAGRPRHYRADGAGAGGSLQEPAAARQ